MKNKVIELIKILEKQPEFKKLNYSLTINYDRVVTDYQPPIFDPKKAIEFLNARTVDNFNLTIIDRYPITYDMSRYDQFWYEAKYIFHGEGKIEMDFNFLSSAVSLQQLRNPPDFKGETNIKDIIELGKLYREASISINEALKKLK